LEITGNVVAAVKDGTYPGGLGVEGVAGVPIAPYPIPVGSPGGKPLDGIGYLVWPQRDGQSYTLFRLGVHFMGCQPDVLDGHQAQCAAPQLQ